MIGQVLGVIPVRLNSARLSQKPLFPLVGKPLIHWVWTNAAKMKVFDELVIATDSEEVAQACDQFGARVEWTSSDHSCGTERVAEVARMKDYERYGLVINVQGDQPLLDESYLEDILIRMGDASWDVGTCGTAFKGESEWRDHSKVKMNIDSTGTVMAFFREVMSKKFQTKPDWNREGYFRHIGTYACKREALLEWASAPKDQKEEEVQLEQLRAMRIGLTIGAIVVPCDKGAVDTLEDARRIEKILAEFKPPSN